MSTKTLYVGNVPYAVTEEQLSSHFSTYGASKVRIIEGRGFAFVDVDADQLATAIADKNNSPMDGRTLTVSEAKPRENSGGGGNRW